MKDLATELRDGLKEIWATPEGADVKDQGENQFQHWLGEEAGRFWTATASAVAASCKKRTCLGACCNWTSGARPEAPVSVQEGRHIPR